MDSVMKGLMGQCLPQNFWAITAPGPMLPREMAGLHNRQVVRCCWTCIAGQGICNEDGLGKVSGLGQEVDRETGGWGTTELDESSASLTMERITLSSGNTIFNK